MWTDTSSYEYLSAQLYTPLGLILDSRTNTIYMPNPNVRTIVVWPTGAAVVTIYSWMVFDLENN
jgi:hypothetical protein